MSDVIRVDIDGNTVPLSPFADADDRFRVIFDAVNDGIFISDPATGRFIDINQPGCRMSCYAKVDLLGRDVDTLSSGIHPHTRDMAIELNERARLGEPQIFEWQCKTSGGALFWTEISLRYAEVGGVPAIVAIIRDIGERKRLDAQIVYLAQHDMLTGLANRSMFATGVDQAIALSLRNNTKFAILCLDLDHFKDVNDTHGHLVGDRLLRLVAQRLQTVSRLNEHVARFGGDEFAILVNDTDGTAEITALANRLIASIGKPYLIDSNEIHVGVCIGVSIYGEDAQDVETLLSHADIALYRAKAEGRQTYRFFSDAMNEEVRARVHLTDDLRHATASGELFLVYQPQVRTRDRCIIGVEALLRWRHPRRGVLAPASFLSVAESSGLMGEIGQWVLREACRQGRKWIDAGIPPRTIAVNLSSAQLKAPLELEKTVLAILAETGFPPKLLELEITETTLINLSSLHEDVIQRLRSIGVRFSLDDFGTGYSSLNYLRRFSVDRIKIAQEFIEQLATSPESVSIVKLIVGLSQDFGSEVIAEGVETLEQLKLLQDLNCPNVQGFYFVRPMSAELVTPLLSGRTIDPAMTLSSVS